LKEIGCHPGRGRQQRRRELTLCKQRIVGVGQRCAVARDEGWRSQRGLGGKVGIVVGDGLISKVIVLVGGVLATVVKVVSGRCRQGREGSRGRWHNKYQAAGRQ
jgi:hypothetical protein